MHMCIYLHTYFPGKRAQRQRHPLGNEQLNTQILVSKCTVHKKNQGSLEKQSSLELRWELTAWAWTTSLCPKVGKCPETGGHVPEGHEEPAGGSSTSG